MSRSQRAFAFLPLALTIVCLAVGIYYFFFREQSPTLPRETISATQETNGSTQESEVLTAIPVTAAKVSAAGSYELELLGTVQAANVVKVFPQTMGEVVKVNVTEGETVKLGDVLAVLGGTNGHVSAAERQYESARTTYETALKGYNNALSVADTAKKSAQIQLESARQQTEASYIDYNAFAENLGAARDGLGYIRVMLGETQAKNRRDLNNLENSVDSMNDAIRELKQERKNTLADLDNQINDSPDDITKAALEAQRDQTDQQFLTQISELETERDKLDSQVSALTSGAVLSETQIQAQLEQSQNQYHTLATTRDSLQYKLGLFDGTSTQLQLAEQQVKAALIQADSGVLQSKSQLDMAALNLESAADQLDNLLVRAPISGTVANIALQQGDAASPQTAIADLLSESGYELKVSVDPETAATIDLTQNAQVRIGKVYVDVPIRSISPMSETGSQLVKVTVGLPSIRLRQNQTLSVRLPVMPSVNENGGAGLMIPLDAVTIGTEEQFVFVADNGKAKRVAVRLGDVRGDLVEILEGLNPDDEIIVNGAKDLVDGQAITLQSA